jgi:hypothetical protein
VHGAVPESTALLPFSAPASQITGAGRGAAFPMFGHPDTRKARTPFNFAGKPFNL